MCLGSNYIPFVFHMWEVVCGHQLCNEVYIQYGHITPKVGILM